MRELKPSKGDILIVDDQPENLEIFSLILTEHGYRVRSAVSGRSALKSAWESLPDLVLLDIRMPDMEGYEVCKRLKADERTRDIPVVFLSVMDQAEDKVRAFAAGCVDYVTKPFQIEEALARVETHLALRAVRRQLEEKNAQLEREIAERRRAEEALRGSERKLKEAQALGRIGNWEFDVTHGTIEWSDETYELYERDLALGPPTPEEEATYYAPEQAAMLRECARRAMETGEEPAYDLQAKLPSGRTAFFSASMRPVRDESGRVVKLFGTVQDITARKRAEEALRESEEQLRQQERLAAIGRLAGGIAHDFNNLLTSIMLYGQILKGKPHLPPDLVPHVETILEESRRAAQLVQQILDFSRRAMIETRPVDLSAFIEKVVGILRCTLPEDIRLALKVGVEKYVVDADPTRIQQVVMNLATNARDAMPEGGELSVGLSRIKLAPGEKHPVAEMAAGEWVCLEVSDTGTGMTDEVHAHLFEPFFTTKEFGKGTGLGLAQVHGIVKQHGGHIRVETKVGSGTTFRIYLPVHRETEAGKDVEEASTPPRGKGEIVLLVEDEEKIREAGRNVLESLGYRVVTAADGQEAWKTYRATEKVDLVITDVVMPEMGGRHLIQALRQADPGLRTLAITGYAAQKDLEELREAGFLGVVRKPFDIDTLATAVRRALDAGGTPDER